MNDQWLIYVPHDQVQLYEADGWRVAADLAHHRVHSVLMLWEETPAPARQLERHPERNERIRRMQAEGVKLAAIAHEFGMSHGAVWAVCNPERRRAHRRAAYKRARAAE